VSYIQSEIEPVPNEASQARSSGRAEASILWIVALLMFSACASYPRTKPLQRYDIAAGYRFEQLPPGLRVAEGGGQNSDNLFVVLAFSGGGTRAAALSYGVLRQLRDVRFHIDDAGAPVECAPAGSPKCKAMERTLLDEVDVISSVSGGSFTAAYYALNGREIFDPAGRFHQDFLYYPLQRDLFSQAVWHPQNWNKLRSRVEIAANLYASRVFGEATFGDLKSRPRPYLVVNAADMSTGARFEFTQEQFDLLCADLDGIPIARGVAASSAFPGLLNSMTIDSFNANATNGGCAYDGPGSHLAADLPKLPPLDRDWVDRARLEDRGRTDRLYAAEQVLAYKDPQRRHLHLLDGGLADNIGARALLHGIGTFDRPVKRDRKAGTEVLGGWSALTLMNQRKARHVLVIVVNARTGKEKTWDTKRTGPGTPSVINVSSGVPMGNFSRETLTRLREMLEEVAIDFGKEEGPKLYGLEIAFQDLPATERQFFSNLGTNFELDPYEVDCLIDRGGRLLRDGRFMEPSTNERPVMTFADFANEVLKGATISPPAETPPDCTPQAGTQHIAVRNHYLDIGAQVGALVPGSDDVERSKVAWGVAVRATRPRWGVMLDIGPQSFEIAADPGAGRIRIGELTLWSFMGGIGRTWRAKRHEFTLGASAGYGLGGFTPTTGVRDAYGHLGVFGLEGDASNAWLAKPQATYWYTFSDGWAATLSTSYVTARPTVHLASGSADVFTREVEASAFRVAIGIGKKIF
jgi:NTE family protein